MKEVLDTRFFVEYFYSDDSYVREEIQKYLQLLLKNRNGVLPTIVISEIVKLTCERRGKEESHLRYLSLIRSGLEISELTSDIAEKAGVLKCVYRDRPYGDCIIAATAMVSLGKLVSDDTHFDGFDDLKRIWIR